MKLSIEAVIGLLELANIQKYTDAYDAIKCIEESSGYRGQMRSASGATKQVIIFKEFDWVIKYCSGNESDAMDEVHIYKQAVEAGLEYLFPKTLFLCELNGIKYIIQEKISFSAGNVPRMKYPKYQRITQTVARDVSEKMQHEFNRANHGHFTRKLDKMWTEMICSLYGRKVCVNLCEFVRQYKINDLHRNNIGYINDRPVILDFSGYENK